MLRKFSVENYKNFEKKIELDFTNKRDYAFRPECIKDNLISKAILMGPNASGKTNLAYGLFDIVYTLTDNMFQALQRDPGSFINANCKDPIAKFRYEFQNGAEIIEYEYHKVTPENIVYESLIVNGQKIFSFNFGTVMPFLKQMRIVGFDKKQDYIDGLEQINADKLNLDGLDGTISALRYIMNNTVQPKGSTISFLKEFVSKMLYFRYVNNGPGFIGFHKSPTLLEEYIINNGLLDNFQNFLRECGIDVELEAGKGAAKGRIVQKFKNSSLFFEPLMSSGTRVLELYFFWSRCFAEVSFLYIDEFDASYHFELAEKILKKTIEGVSAQTVFTTHNTYLVNTDLMRPDCYLQIKNGKIGSFADSTDRELREAHNLEKMLRNKEFE